MKTACVLLAALALAPTASSRKLVQSPVTKVVSLLKELRGVVVADGKKEQQSYDKFACWCEETMQRKTADIAREKDTIEEMQTLMTKLKGELGAHGAEIEQLKKDIAANLESQHEATEAREKENADFEGTKTELEQSIGALEGAIKVLTGAGAGKGGFLDLQRANLLGVAADVKRLLYSRLGAQWSEGKDLQELQAVQRFLEKPEALLQRQSGLVQVGQNPFGDYAPQSTQIQGILKGMYDAFTSDLEKGNVRESESQKSFEELLATKNSELETLRATLLRQEGDAAAENKRYADSKSARDNNAALLEADEALFADTKESCKAKASEWAERSRLRTEELTGLDQALSILDSPEARATFASAAMTLVQLSAVTEGHRQSQGADMAARRLRAYAKLRELAAKEKDLGLAQVAVAVKMAGHFDEVITMIDHMVGLIRKEEQDDITHRDRCQNSQAANEANIEDLEHTLEKTQQELSRVRDRVKVTRGKISQLNTDITATNEDLDSRLEIRNKEHANFEQALKDDTNSVALLQQAMETLQAFYKNNNIPLNLMQAKVSARQEPTYAVDKDKAPETEWSGGNYGGRSEEHSNILAIIEMIVEDVEKEIKTSRAEEAATQKQYEADATAMRAQLKALQDTKVEAEKELADLQSKAVGKEGFHTETDQDLSAQEELKVTLERDCAWVKTHFASRSDKRKAELEGLAEAKSILAGVNAGDFDELVVSTGA